MRRALAAMAVVGFGLGVVTGEGSREGTRASAAEGASAVMGDSAVRWTGDGAVRGSVRGDHVVWQGIPFAAPPVGESRWRTPRPARPWRGVRDATRPGPVCVQDARSGTAGRRSEDCLYLDITAPRRAPERLRPVVVWLPGGGFMSGAGSDYDPWRLAVRGDVVVVTVNYRLGAFGFFAHAALPGSGEFGLLDQQAALKWVRHNAAVFGGDPDNVTLAGQSAGAMSVCAHLVSPSSADLFHRAILQSGSCALQWPPFTGERPGGPFQPRETLAAGYRELVRGTGCDGARNVLDCLRRVPPEALLEPGRTEASAGFGGEVLPRDPLKALREGDFHRIPVLIGTTRDEGRGAAVSLHPRPASETDYRTMLAEDFGPAGAAVAARYPAGGNPGLAYGEVITDSVWARSTWRAQRWLSGRVPTYAFEFADRDAPNFAGFPDVGIPLGAFHGAEIPYLFDVDGAAVRFSPAQRLLADRMVGYWSRFAWTGDPNGPGLPRWDRFRAEGALPAVQGLGPGAGGVRRVDYPAEHRLRFWVELLSRR